jgi:uncharacterized protein (DUF362 family)
MQSIAVTKGLVRYDNVFHALRLLESQLGERISKCKRIVIKPDLLHNAGCAEQSHLDAMRAVLEFVETYTNKRITIAEGAFIGDDIFSHHGYYDLRNDHAVKFINLEYDDTVPIRAGSKTVPVSKIIVSSDFRISLSPLRADPRLGLMGTIPNIVLGSITGHGKEELYQSRSRAAEIAAIATVMKPHLSIIDAFIAEKGKKLLELSTAIAGTDAVAVDAGAAKLLKVKAPYLTAAVNAGVGKKSAKTITP